MNTVNIRHGPRKGQQICPICVVIARYFSKLLGFARRSFIIVRRILYADVSSGTNIWLRQCQESRQKNRLDKTPRKEREMCTSEQKIERKTRESIKEWASKRICEKETERRIGVRVSISERITVYDVRVCESQKESKLEWEMQEVRWESEWQDRDDGARQWVSGDFCFCVCRPKKQKAPV